jgi:hypothetical protein
MKIRKSCFKHNIQPVHTCKRCQAFKARYDSLNHFYLLAQYVNNKSEKKTV